MNKCEISVCVGVWGMYMWGVNVCVCVVCVGGCVSWYVYVGDYGYVQC